MWTRDSEIERRQQTCMVWYGSGESVTPSMMFRQEGWAWSDRSYICTTDDNDEEEHVLLMEELDALEVKDIFTLILYIWLAWHEV